MFKRFNKPGVTKNYTFTATYESPKTVIVEDYYTVISNNEKLNKDDNYKVSSHSTKIYCQEGTDLNKDLFIFVYRKLRDVPQYGLPLYSDSDVYYELTSSYTLKKDVNSIIDLLNTSSNALIELIPSLVKWGLNLDDYCDFKSVNQLLKIDEATVKVERSNASYSAYSLSNEFKSNTFTNKDIYNIIEKYLNILDEDEIFDVLRKHLVISNHLSVAVLVRGYIKLFNLVSYSSSVSDCYLVLFKDNKKLLDDIIQNVINFGRDLNYNAKCVLEIVFKHIDDNYELRLKYLNKLDISGVYNLIGQSNLFYYLLGNASVREDFIKNGNKGVLRDLAQDNFPCTPKRIMIDNMLVEDLKEHFPNFSELPSICKKLINDLFPLKARGYKYKHTVETIGYLELSDKEKETMLKAIAMSFVDEMIEDETYDAGDIPLTLDLVYSKEDINKIINYMIQDLDNLTYDRIDILIRNIKIEFLNDEDLDTEFTRNIMNAITNTKTYKKYNLTKKLKKEINNDEE